MDVLKLTFHVADPSQDLLIAELDSLGFEAFMQEDELLKAYLPENSWDERYRTYLENWLKEHGFTPIIEEERIAPSNWNATWEQSISPIAVAGMYIRPSWHPPSPDETLVDLVIDPKMSFGTGHHESTRLALGLLAEVIEPGQRVLDAGTGTAVLAIAAVKRGAGAVLAFDVDTWVEDNVRENLEQNGVTADVVYRHGTLDVIPESGFDLILANINRNVLLDYLQPFANKMRPFGKLILSGILIEDRPVMIEAAAQAGFQLFSEKEESPWWAGAFWLEQST